MMKRILAMVLVCGCGAVAPNAADSDATSCPTEAGVVEAGVVEAGVVEAGVVEAGVVEAGVVEAGLDAGQAPLSVTSLTPSQVPKEGGVLVVMRGSGFLGLRDVQVNVYSVPFRVLDDGVAVFLAIAMPDPGLYAVDVIRIQPDQVQVSLTYW